MDLTSGQKQTAFVRNNRTDKTVYGHQVYSFKRLEFLLKHILFNFRSFLFSDIFSL